MNNELSMIEEEVSNDDNDSYYGDSFSVDDKKPTVDVHSKKQSVLTIPSTPRHQNETRHVTLDTKVIDINQVSTILKLVDVTNNVFNCDQKLERLEQFLSTMSKENYFDEEDVKMLKNEINDVKQQKKNLLKDLTKKERKEVTMRVILKQREKTIEKAVGAEVLHPQDDNIFTFLVQKQCSLTAIIDRKEEL